MRIAVFISPHGFGHAARSAAIMATLQETEPAIRFDIFTQVPRWFFQESLPDPFGYHDVLTDLGLVQQSALQADLDATIERLDAFLPYDQERVINPLAQQLRDLGCGLVMCDIAPMGIAVAKAAGLPSVLIENFTWDWIYQAYADAYPAIRPHIEYVRNWFDSVNYRIQTEPICRVRPAVLTTAPVYRKAKVSRGGTRARLGIAPDAKMIMLTMGGIPGHYPFVKQLTTYSDLAFVIPGGAPERQQQQNVILLPHRSEFFHPDLVHAADAVVGKVGYSTVAEVYSAGIPMGYIERADFRESPALVEFIDREMQGLAIEPDTFDDGRWMRHLYELLELPRLPRHGPNGADQAAPFIISLLGP